MKTNSSNKKLTKLAYKSLSKRGVNQASRSPHKSSVLTNPWRKSTTGQPKTEKAANQPTTSTATKSISQDLTDKDGILLWFGEYTACGRLKEETKVTDSAYHPFRLQNQYCDRERG